MWLLTTSIAALIATLLGLLLNKKYKLGTLSLLLWGAAIMILVDHLLAYEGGMFLEAKTDGMITSGALLGITMLIPVLCIWCIALFISKPRRESVQ